MRLGVDTYSLRFQGWDAFQTLDYAAGLGLDVPLWMALDVQGAVLRDDVEVPVAVQHGGPDAHCHDRDQEVGRAHRLPLPAQPEAEPRPVLPVLRFYRELVKRTQKPAQPEILPLVGRTAGNLQADDSGGGDLPCSQQRAHPLT